MRRSEAKTDTHQHPPKSVIVDPERSRFTARSNLHLGRKFQLRPGLREVNAQLWSPLVPSRPDLDREIAVAAERGPLTSHEEIPLLKRPLGLWWNFGLKFRAAGQETSVLRYERTGAGDLKRGRKLSAKRGAAVAPWTGCTSSIMYYEGSINASDLFSEWSSA